MKSNMKPAELIILAFISTFLFIFCTAGIAHAQTTASDDCPKAAYLAEYKKTTAWGVNKISGLATTRDPDNISVAGNAELGLSGLCLDLFDESTKTLRVSIKTDENGNFDFGGLSQGSFLLVASHKGVKSLIIPLRLNNSGKDSAERAMLLHIRFENDHQNSFASLIQRNDVRRQLLDLRERDQKARNEQIAKGSGKTDKTDEARLETLDNENTAQLKKIIRQIGYPFAELVGTDGVDAAFLIIQHTNDVKFRDSMLPFIEKAYHRQQISGSSYALFIDRLLVYHGREQIYGTQAKPFAEWKDRQPTFYPIKDEANVDKRRAVVGLGSLREYTEFLVKMYFPQSSKP